MCKKCRERTSIKVIASGWGITLMMHVAIWCLILFLMLDYIEKDLTEICKFEI